MSKIVGDPNRFKAACTPLDIQIVVNDLFADRHGMFFRHIKAIIAEVKRCGWFGLMNIFYFFDGSA